MELKKHFNLPVSVNIKFFELQLKDEIVDNSYFINKIKEGCELNTNMNFVTNVKGKMTDWTYFREDVKFIDVLKKVLLFSPLDHKLELVEAWGIKMDPGHFTKMHAHSENHFSGILYLNDADNKIFFPQINLEIQPKKNTVLIFSGILNHYTNSVEKNTKYAIPFNMMIAKEWNK